MSGRDVAGERPARALASTIHVDVDSDAESMRSARRAVMTLLDGAPAVLVRDAVLLTSELVTNAVLHAGGSCTVAAAYDPDRRSVVVRVEDGSPLLPTIPEPATPWSTGGRGLAIVDQVATHWGSAATDEGKVVWFELVAEDDVLPGA